MADDDEQPDDAPRSGLYASTTAVTQRHRDQRRKQAIVGVAGAAAVLAGGGFLVTQLVMSSQQAALPEPAAQAPMTAASTATEPAMTITAPPVTRTTKGFRPAEPVERSPTPTREATTERAPERPRVSASAAEPTGEVGIQSVEDVSEWTEDISNGTVRIVTARRDLTGERELLLAGDEGRPAGRGVHCTSDVRLDTVVDEERQPAALLCWRTSARRSVITLAIVPRGGDVPAGPNVEIVSREWARLGQGRVGQGD